MWWPPELQQGIKEDEETKEVEKDEEERVGGGGGKKMEEEKQKKMKKGEAEEMKKEKKKRTACAVCSSSVKVSVKRLAMHSKHKPMLSQPFVLMSSGANSLERKKTAFTFTSIISSYCSSVVAVVLTKWTRPALFTWNANAVSCSIVCVKDRCAPVIYTMDTVCLKPTLSWFIIP